MKILSEQEYVHFMHNFSPLVVNIVGVALLILVIAGVFLIFISITELGKISYLFFGAGVLIFVLVAGAIFIPEYEPHTKYKATVEDWNYIMDNDYEVIEQEGEIVTLIKYHDRE